MRKGVIHIFVVYELYFSYDAPTLHLQKISGFLTRRYAPLQKTLILS